MTVNVTDTVGANNTIVLDGNSKIPAIDGSQVTALVATAFTTGTLATARIDTGTTAGKILQLDGSARIPAISGANLTNVPGPTNSTSDPAVDTNLTLGKKWINKTSGEVYICTDATAGENVWTNVGAGSGNILKFHAWGSNYGYSYGSNEPAQGDVDRYSFTSDGNATDVGDMSVSRYGGGGSSSETYAYKGGGYAAGTYTNIIDRHPFATNGTMVDVGDLTVGRSYISSSSSETYGYCSGGAPGNTNVIEKWAFASATTNATDVGDLTVGRGGSGSASSSNYGYHCCGGPYTNIIDKYAYASDGNATDVGDTPATTNQNSGCQSDSTGYIVGGYRLNDALPYSANIIWKFSFATDGNATDVGDLTQLVFGPSTSSSTTHGYRAGGNQGWPASNVIDKFSFATDGNAVDVGDLPNTKTYMANGCQY